MVMTLKDKLLGTGMLTYGCLKVFIGGTGTFATEEQKTEITKVLPVMKNFYSDDETTANRGLEFAFFLFGLFSVAHGLNKFGLLSHKNSELLERPSTETLVYAILGFGLTLFYSAVVYTDLPIQKDPANIPHYKMLGITSGLSFLIMLPFASIMHDRAVTGSLKGVWNDGGSGRLQITLFVAMLAAMARMINDGLGSKSIKQDLVSIATIVGNQF
jgi:hypothetical protein